MKRLQYWAAATLMAVSGLFVLDLPVQAADGNLAFELYATHPYASRSGYDQDSVNYYTGTKFCPAPEGETRFLPSRAGASRYEYR